jgi:hypothetical protein
MTDLQRRFTLRRMALVSRCVVTGLLAVLIAGSMLSGCGPDTPEGNPDTGSGEKEKSTAIEPIIESLQPGEYDISVPRELPTTYLNSWGKENLETLLRDDVDEEALKKKLSALLSDDQIERVLRREFVIRDSAHIRDMIWARQLIVEKSVDDELELARLTRMFYHVVQTVRLIEDVETALPLSPFEAMLYGRGTAADRAWIFSCLTRQLKVPLLLVDFGQDETANGDGSDSSSPLIGGILLDGKLYLFDFQIGLPIPSASCPAEEPLPSIPATLAEVQSNDAVLRALDVGDDLPYRATASQFQQVRLLLAGESSVWARRIEALSYGMSGTTSAPVLWEPLVSHGAFEDGGIIQIVTEAMVDRVKPESIGIWDYPERQRIAREELTKAQNTLLDKIHEPMEAPRPYRQALVKSGLPRLEYGSGRQMQLRARIAQVLGRPQEAIPLYVRLQAWRNASPKSDPNQLIDDSLLEQAKRLPEDVLKLHSRAAMESSFWQATSQLELKRHSAAASAFKFWILTSSSPELTGQAILLIAISRALQGDLIPASGLLKRIPRENAYFPQAQILLKRWQAIEAAKETEAAK